MERKCVIEWKTVQSSMWSHCYGMCVHVLLITGWIDATAYLREKLC